MNNKSEHIKTILSLLPNKPGVYQFFGVDNKIIYVGKAKDLKKRVSSYFNRLSHESNKVRVLTEKVIDIKHIVVANESDALLLENNLIKKYQPRYNILLKDDKTFPWVCIKNENFPRVFYTRKLYKDNSLYFGPYTSVKMVKTLLDLIKHLYKLRTCNYSLDSESISKGKFKVCLEYHIGNCAAPCVGLQTSEDYNETILQIKNIIKGNLQNVMNHLDVLMKRYASEYKFEEANTIKDKIAILESYKSKSTIVNPSIKNVDVFYSIDDEKYAYINYLKITEGAIIQAHNVEILKKLDETISEILEFAIIDIRYKLLSDSDEIFVPVEIDLNIPDVKISVPKIGDKKKLLDLSERNARQFKFDREHQRNAYTSKKGTSRVLERLMADLNLKNLPNHIECFDNSNIQGTSPVASCVVFREGKPSKKDYRHFNIKTVEGPDDFASMREIVYRRYKRLLEEGTPLPQLVIIDGGKGQLNAALESIAQLGIRKNIAIIGIAKKLEEIYFPGDSVPLYLNKNSESLKLIQQLRNEAHRFGIEFHRTKRSQKMLTSEFDDIPGIGEKTMILLIQSFKTIDAVKDASLDEIQKVIGKAKAKQVAAYFRKADN
jgi:excinuclease ABC subunit C